MKRMIKIIPVVLIMCLILMSVFTNVFADIDTTMPNSTTNIGTVKTGAEKIWGTVTTIVQILAFAAIVFAGLKYMFASADQKADIKKSMGVLVLGAILVFAASTVVQFITTAANEVIL